VCIGVLNGTKWVGDTVLGVMAFRWMSKDSVGFGIGGGHFGGLVLLDFTGRDGRDGDGVGLLAHEKSREGMMGILSCL
jgi:hypothetical protein